MTQIPMDFSKLLRRMADYGMTQEELAKAAGIKPVRMKQKLNNLLGFTVRETDSIRRVLDIPRDQEREYFYTPKGDEEIPGGEECALPSLPADDKRTKVADYTLEQLDPKHYPGATRSAKVVQIIETRVIAGTGTEADPVREQVRYWSLDGELLGHGI